MSDMTSHPSFARTGLTWDEVETLCEQSDAVKGYDFDDAGRFAIEWVDGNVSTFGPTQQVEAANEVREMSRV